MIMTWNTKWQLTFVMISFKLNWVGRYLAFFQHHRLLFFTTTPRTSQREEEFKSTIGCSVDRPVSLTNCFEQHSKSAILEIVNQRSKVTEGDHGKCFDGPGGKNKNPIGVRGVYGSCLCFEWSPFSIVKRFNLIIFHCGHMYQSKTRTIIPIPGLKCNNRDDEAKIANVLKTMVDIVYLPANSHACGLKTSISRRLTLAGQFLTPDWEMWVVGVLLDTISKNMLTQTHVRNENHV